MELVNLPLRDHYRPRWSWIPRFLPAQTRCLIPVSWDVVNRDEEASGFVASMDIEGPADGERVEATRVTFGGASSKRGRVRLWLPLGPLVSGALDARPGIVWEDVRWYRAEDWFAYQPVRVVPPLLYVAAAILVAGVLAGWWSWIARWRWRGIRFVGRLAALFGWVWLAAQLVISGYWIVIAILGAVVVAVRIPWKLAGTRAYVVAWLLLSFIEIYWGRLSGVAPVWRSATALAIAGWALLLLPLVWVRPAWLRRTITVSVVMAWLLVSTASVIYYQFFQDFPSVENLLYANQVGALGDSILALVEQRHLIPLLVAGAALLFVPPLIDAGQQAADEVPAYVDRLSQSSLVQDLDREYGVGHDLGHVLETGQVAPLFAELTDHDVVRFEITVNHASFVSLLDAPGGLTKNRHRLLKRER